MDLLNHPPASSEQMFTATEPHVKDRQHRLAGALEEEYKANELPANNKAAK